MKNAEASGISRRRFAIGGLSTGAALLASGALFAEGVQPQSGNAQSTELPAIKSGIGHNLPQEAPQAFAQAVLDVDGY